MRKLAEILSGPETWCQGRLSDGRSRRCLVGALASMPGSHALFLREYARLERLIEVADGPLPGSVATWNDAPGQTWEEVAAIVEAADRDRLVNP